MYNGNDSKKLKGNNTFHYCILHSLLVRKEKTFNNVKIRI